MGDHNEGSWILRLLFWGQIAKIGKFPSHQDLKNKNCRLSNCTLLNFSLILFCRKSNEKQIIGHYLAPPLNLTCKVPMFIEQSFALTLASFVSKSPLSQKKKKNSHPPLVWSDLIMALQNPRLEKIFTLNLFLRADVQMKQALCRCRTCWVIHHSTILTACYFLCADDPCRIIIHFWESAHLSLP